MAGTLAKDLFAIGLVGAALLAASILPLSTAYSVSDLTGRPAGIDDKPKEAPLFYMTFGFITVLAAVLVLIFGGESKTLLTLLVFTQVLNAVLLLPLLLYMFGIARDKKLMGEYRASKNMQITYSALIAIVALCIGCMLWFTVN